MKRLKKYITFCRREEEQKYRRKETGGAKNGDGRQVRKAGTIGAQKINIFFTGKLVLLEGEVIHSICTLLYCWANSL